MKRSLLKKLVYVFLLTIALYLSYQGRANDSTTAVQNSAPYERASSAKPSYDTLPSPIDVYVNDFEGIFSGQQKDSLRRQIAAISKTGSMVFCVITIDSSAVSPSQIDSFTLQLANYWGVGDRAQNNGVVICFSKAGRRLRIENGKGIAKVLTNADTDGIMNSVIFPSFKAGNYFAGVSSGIRAIITLYNKKTERL